MILADAARGGAGGRPALPADARRARARRRSAASSRPMPAAPRCCASGTMRSLVLGHRGGAPRRQPVRGADGAQEGQSRLRSQAAADRRRGHARRRHRGEPEAGAGDRRARGRLGRASRSPAAAHGAAPPSRGDAWARRSRASSWCRRARSIWCSRMFRARAPPLAAPAPWNVLVEAVAPMAAPGPEPLLYEGLRSALETGLVADAVIAASEAQAEDFWRLRDSHLGGGEEGRPGRQARHFGPGRGDGRLHDRGRAPRSRRASRARGSTPSAISATATSISTSARRRARRRTGSRRQGEAVSALRPRSGHRRRAARSRPSTASAR